MRLDILSYNILEHRYFKHLTHKCRSFIFTDFMSYKFSNNKKWFRINTFKISSVF